MQAAYIRRKTTRVLGTRFRITGRLRQDVGVGGEGREEGVDIGSVDAILGEGSVCTYVLEVILGTCLTDQVEEAA